MNAPETNHAFTRAAAQAAATLERASCGCRPTPTSLKLERHHVGPATKSLPVGSTQHLVFVSLGRGRIDLERGGESISRELRLGSVAVYPAGLPIRWTWDTPLSYSVLALDPAFVNHIACRVYDAAPGDFELLPAERDHDFGLATLLGPLGHEVGPRGADSALYLESLANILTVHLLRHYGRWRRGGPRVTAGGCSASLGGQPLPAPVDRAIRYIHQHHADDIELRDIAKAAGLSPFHLARVFKEAVGLPPHRYLVQVRVQRARSLLAIASERHSLAEVAAAAGFSDQSHLTRHFKRAFGVTPRQFTTTVAMP